MIINTIDGIVHRLNKKSRRIFDINKSSSDALEIISGKLPDKNSVYKIISLTGGLASISFIKAVADKEIIEELTCSTLRVGKKQFLWLENLRKCGRLEKATFFIGSIMKEDVKSEKYDYYSEFLNYCAENNWDLHVVNNHSKIFLMRTQNNHYVLETSSNLNDNPKIEQYSFENDKELYDFYYMFFTALKEVKNNK